jgi:hypothetical protein
LPLYFHPNPEQGGASHRRKKRYHEKRASKKKKFDQTTVQIRRKGGRVGFDAENKDVP